MADVVRRVRCRSACGRIVEGTLPFLWGLGRIKPLDVCTCTWRPHWACRSATSRTVGSADAPGRPLRPVGVTRVDPHLPRRPHARLHWCVGRYLSGSVVLPDPIGLFTLMSCWRKSKRHGASLACRTLAMWDFSLIENVHYTEVRI